MIQVTNIRLDYGKLQKDNRYRITENPNPVFSWAVRSDGDNVTQEACFVKVWSEGEIFWETGWITSKEQEITYAGAKFPHERRIYVSVAVRDSRKEYSKPYEEYFFLSALSELDLTWIAAAEDKEDQALYLKKDFICQRKVVHATMYACGLGYHELYLNGKRVDTSILDPAVSDYTKHCYYVVLTEVEHLLNNQNCIGVVIGQGWRRNEECEPRGWVQVKFFGKPQLSLALSLVYDDGTTEVIYTDETWLCGDGPIVYSHLFNGEIFDAGCVKKDWNLFSGATEGFEAARFVEAPGGIAASMELEPIREQEIYKVRTVTPIRDGVYVVDFGQNIAGACSLRLPQRMKMGHRIQIKYMEFLDEDGSVYMDTLRTAKSTDTYIASGDERDLTEWKPSFTYHGFRYAQVEGLDFIDCEVITAVSYYSDVVTDSFFSCGSALVNAIHKNIFQTEKANIHSILTDCPQRDERLAWMNDATVRFAGTPYNFDVGRLFPKVVQDILDTQSGDGAITCTAPFVLGFRPADPVCAAFLVAGQEAVLHTGNLDIIRKAYDGFVMWENRIRQLAVDNIVDYTVYGDWAAPVYACKDGDTNIDARESRYTPGAFMSTGYYYYNAVLLAKFAHILEKTEDEAYYQSLAEQIRISMLQKWWNKEQAVMATGSQGCQSFALWLGIIPKEHCKAAARLIHEDLIQRNYYFTTGNLCTRYMLEMLTKYGYVEDAWTLITREEYPSIGYMIQNEATTIWERFELKKSKDMNSHNHPMYGSVGYWFYAYLAGIRPVKKGFEKMVIRPYFPRKLLSVNAKVETVKGDVIVRWVRRYGKAYLYVTLPFGTQAEIIFSGKSYIVGSGFHMYEMEENALFSE